MQIAKKKAVKPKAKRIEMENVWKAFARLNLCIPFSEYKSDNLYFPSYLFFFLL